MKEIVQLMLEAKWRGRNTHRNAQFEHLDRAVPVILRERMYRAAGSVLMGCTPQCGDGAFARASGVGGDTRGTGYELQKLRMRRALKSTCATSHQGPTRGFSAMVGYPGCGFRATGHQPIPGRTVSDDKLEAIFA